MPTPSQVRPKTKKVVDKKSAIEVIAKEIYVRRFKEEEEEEEEGITRKDLKKILENLSHPNERESPHTREKTKSTRQGSSLWF